MGFSSFLGQHYVRRLSNLFTASRLGLTPNDGEKCTFEMTSGAGQELLYSTYRERTHKQEQMRTE